VSGISRSVCLQKDIGQIENYCKLRIYTEQESVWSKGHVGAVEMIGHSGRIANTSRTVVFKDFKIKVGRLTAQRNSFKCHCLHCELGITWDDHIVSHPVA